MNAVESRSSAAHKSIPTCARCDYNLSGLTSCTCPECGWPIDWELARHRGDQWRSGTPAHRARGWRVIDQTLLTLLVMLCAPWRFARELRSDESIWAALAVAALSFVSLFVWWPTFDDLWRSIAIYGSAVTAVIVCQALCFSTLDFSGGRWRLPWLRRLRLWLLVSLYSTCFVAAWRLAGAPPVVSRLTETNFYWPLRDGSLWWDSGPGVTVIFYWWWAILGTVLIVRNRPRWLAALSIPLVFLFSWIGYLAAFSTYNWLD